MFKRMSVFFLVLLFAAAITPAVSFAAFPEKPVTIMVPYNPGGGSDSSARVMAKYISKYLDNPVVVSNKPGGGGFSEPSRILKTRNLHDGYMLMLLGGIMSTRKYSSSSIPIHIKISKPLAISP